MPGSDPDQPILPLNETILFSYYTHDPRAETYKYPAHAKAQLVVFMSMVIILSIMIVATRLWAKLRKFNTFGVDDWLIIPAEVCLSDRLHRVPSRFLPGSRRKVRSKREKEEKKKKNVYLNKY